MRNNERLCVSAAGEKRVFGSLITGSVCDTGHSEQNSGLDPGRSDCSLAQGPEIHIYVLKQRALTTEGADPISHEAKGICERLVLGPRCLEGDSRRRTLWEKTMVTSALLVIHEADGWCLPPAALSALLS